MILEISCGKIIKRGINGGFEWDIHGCFESWVRKALSLSDTSHGSTNKQMEKLQRKGSVKIFFASKWMPTDNESKWWKFAKKKVK